MDAQERCLEWVATTKYNGSVMDLYEDLAVVDFSLSHSCSEYFVHHTQLFNAVQYVTTVLIGVTQLINMGLFTLAMVRALEAKSFLSLPRSIHILLLLSLFMVFGYIPILYSIWGEWRGSEQDARACTILYDITTATYVAVSCCVYNLLYLRASAVLKSAVFVNHRKIQIVLRVAQIVTYSVPGFIVFAIIFFDGVVTPPGQCNFISELWVNIVFHLTDTALSVTYLLLFLYPVSQVLDASQGALNDPSNALAKNNLRLLNTAKRNLKLSSLVICTSFTTLTIGAIGSALLKGEKPTIANLPDQLIPRIFTMSLGVDRLCVTLVCYSMTSQWIPSPMLKSDTNVWCCIPLCLFRYGIPKDSSTSSNLTKTNNNEEKGNANTAVGGDTDAGSKTSDGENDNIGGEILKAALGDQMSENYYDSQA